MTLDALKTAAARAYPDCEVTSASAGNAPNHAVEITLKRGEKVKRWLLHAFTGKDLGDPVPAGFLFTAWPLDLHDKPARRRNRPQG